MSTMIMRSLSPGWFVAGEGRAPATNRQPARGEATFAASPARAAAALGVVLGLGAATVLAPALGPPPAEAARLEEAKTIQTLANLQRLRGPTGDDTVYWFPAFPPPVRSDASDASQLSAM